MSTFRSYIGFVVQRGQLGVMLLLRVYSTAAFVEYCIKLCTFTLTGFKLTQDRIKQDKTKQIKFCNEFLNLMNWKPNILNMLSMSNGRCLHMCGYVCRQNGAPNSPQELHQRLFHSEKMAV